MSKTIINGIDVSECEHHYTNPVNGIIYHGCSIYEQINELGYTQDTLCEQNPNCYFKQFKRLEQENKELKEKAPMKLIGKNNKYRSVLKEIRKEANRLLYEENPIYGYNNSNYFELLAKYVLAKIKEVLNDRN